MGVEKDKAVNGLIQGIDTVIIRVRDLERSAQWYSSKVGLPVVYRDPALKLAVLDTFGPTSITLWQVENGAVPGTDAPSFPIFRTPDAVTLRARLTGLGVEAGEILSDATVTYFRFWDPDGNVLESCQVRD